MNKAFVKEPDGSAAPHCPRCGSLGVDVGPTTLDQWLPAPRRSCLGEVAYFCLYGGCAVAYFDAFERCVEATELVGPVFPKDPTAPVCPCFGLTLEQIEDDARQGITERVKQVVTAAGGPSARCATTTPTGRSCAADVQRAFLRVWQPPAT